MLGTRPEEGANASPCKGEVGAKRRVGVDRMSRFDHTPAKTARARRLRRGMTAAEMRLWSRLRSAQQRGYSFRRQHPMGPYVLDFYRRQLGLVVEVDGSHHGHPDQRKADARRSEWLAERGLAVLRFWNDDILRDMPRVVDEICRTLERLEKPTPTRSATPTDLPLAGGGKGGSLDIVFGEVDR